MSKIVTEVTCPHCEGIVTIERPAPVKRGALAGLALSEMTLEQLKREKINSSSVLYKATKRNAPADLVAKNQDRVDAVVAEIASRVGTVSETASEDVYNETVSEEV